MARLISFALTERAMMRGDKTVTRRLGWLSLKAGDEIVAVRKSMGLGKGGKAHRLARLRVVKVSREPLMEITQDDVTLEGFASKSPEWFIQFFCKSHKHCWPESPVTRIEFEVIEFLALRGSSPRAEARPHHEGKISANQAKQPSATFGGPSAAKPQSGDSGKTS